VDGLAKEGREHADRQHRQHQGRGECAARLAFHRRAHLPSLAIARARLACAGAYVGSIRNDLWRCAMASSYRFIRISSAPRLFSIAAESGLRRSAS
jgi:hypothetical protein